MKSSRTRCKIRVNFYDTKFKEKDNELFRKKRESVLLNVHTFTHFSEELSLFTTHFQY